MSIIFTMTSCVDETPPEADLESKSNLMARNVAGFQWFPDVYEEYTTNPAYAQDLLDSYQEGTHTFVVFGQPDCSCEDSDGEMFAKVTKVLDEMGVTEDQYELYIASSINGAHPYENKFAINTLPAFFVLKNEVAVYSILDSVYQRVINNDTLNPTSLIMEAHLVDALKK